MKPFNGVRIFGNMLPPTVQMAMAIERIVCVCFPLFYRNVYSKAEKPIAAACLLLSMAVVAAGKGSAHLKKIKCYIAVTLLSTLLVAIPNIESILHSYLIYISNEISRAVVWANATNSTVNVIAFCSLNSKLKQHIKTACSRSVRTVQIASSAVVKPLK
uniref:G_PROTEIN_RECEP_F1_2 domain-containing protein n=1 Tax=Steinernema glaseri TaxID=37863 RepID=A0A1I8AJY2_9BILA